MPNNIYHIHSFGFSQQREVCPYTNIFSDWNSLGDTFYSESIVWPRKLQREWGY